jgi:secreted PhoX family phosphatase
MKGRFFFSTKRDNRVWAYNIESHRLSLAYDLATSASPILSGVDNLAITPTGDVLVAEDGGHMQLVALTSDEKVMPVLQIVGHDRSEITGPAFDPSFERLYFSSQRGSDGTSADGVTYEITYLGS